MCGPDWDPHKFSWTARYTIWAYLTCVCILCTSVMFGFLLFWTIDRREVKEKTPPKGPRRIAFLILLSWTMRCVWEFCHYGGNDKELWMRIINRLCMLLQFSAVSLLVLGWATVISRSTSGMLPEDGKPTTRPVLLGLLGLNVILYVVTLILGATGETTPFYKASLVAISICSLVTCVVLLYWAVRIIGHVQGMAVSAQQSERVSRSPADAARLVDFQRVSMRVAVTCAILTCFFLMRTIVFTLAAFSVLDIESPTTAADCATYPLMYYQLPEFFPNTCILFAIFPWKRLQQHVKRKTLTINSTLGEGVRTSPLHMGIEHSSSSRSTLDVMADSESVPPVEAVNF